MRHLAIRQSIAHFLCRVVVCFVIVGVLAALALSSPGNSRALDQPGKPQAASERKGRIFAEAVLRTRARGTDKGQVVEGIVAIDPETGNWKRVVGEGRRPRVSPDGKTLVFLKGSETWVCDTQGHDRPVRIAEIGAAPIWSPDGRHVIIGKGDFRENVGWKFQTWQVEGDGSNRIKLPLPETDQVSDWSADGKWLLVASDRHQPRGFNYQLYLARPDGKEERRLTSDGLNCYARFSPDGRSIVYQRSDRGGGSIWVRDVEGKNARKVVAEDGLRTVDSACWSPNGRQLAAVRFDWRQTAQGEKFLDDTEQANFAIEIMDADGKNRRELKLVDVAKVINVGHCPDWR